MENVAIRTGSNFTNVQLGNLIVNFSYTEPISFAYKGQRTTRVNAWGPTTGKHLNACDGGDKASRVSGEDFETLLDCIIKETGLA